MAPRNIMSGISDHQKKAVIAFIKNNGDQVVLNLQNELNKPLMQVNYNKLFERLKPQDSTDIESFTKRELLFGLWDFINSRLISSPLYDGAVPPGELNYIDSLTAHKLGQKTFRNLWKFWFIIPGSLNVVDLNEVGRSVLKGTENLVTSSLGQMKFIPSKVNFTTTILPGISKFEAKTERAIMQKDQEIYRIMTQELLSTIPKCLSRDYHVLGVLERKLEAQFNSRVLEPLLDFVSGLFNKKIKIREKGLNFQKDLSQGHSSTNPLIKKRLESLEKESVELFPDSSIFDESEEQINAQKALLLIEHKKPKLEEDIKSSENFNTDVINKSLIQTYSYLLCKECLHLKKIILNDLVSTVFIKFPDNFCEEGSENDESNGSSRLIAEIQYYLVNDTHIYANDPTIDEKFNSKILLGSMIYDEMFEDEQEPREEPPKRRKVKTSSRILNSLKADFWGGELITESLEFNDGVPLSRTRSKISLMFSK